MRPIGAIAVGATHRVVREVIVAGLVDRLLRFGDRNFVLLPGERLHRLALVLLDLAAIRDRDAGRRRLRQRGQRRARGRGWRDRDRRRRCGPCRVVGLPLLRRALHSLEHEQAVAIAFGVRRRGLPVAGERHDIADLVRRADVMLGIAGLAAIGVRALGFRYALELHLVVRARHVDDPDALLGRRARVVT